MTVHYPRPMITFGLVHGAWHGAWCWERLTPVLKDRGHGVVAPTLGFDQPGTTFQDQADTVIDALADAEDVVLVGHSLGSCTATFVAQRRRPRRLVHLCGVIPGTLGSWGAADEPRFDEHGIYRLVIEDADRCTAWPRGSMRDTMYADLDAETAAWAEARARRQCSATAWEAFEPLPRMPEVPTTTVIAREDRAVSPAWSRWAAQRRLGGIDPIEISGGHWPMLTMPGLLADLLISLT